MALSLTASEPLETEFLSTISPVNKFLLHLKIFCTRLLHVMLYRSGEWHSTHPPLPTHPPYQLNPSSHLGRPSQPQGP